MQAWWILWNRPMKLFWSSLNREMAACLWEDRIVLDFVNFVHIQASLSYNHIACLLEHQCCIGSSMICIIFIDLTVVGLNEECETEFPLIIKPLFGYILICGALKWIYAIQEKKLLWHQSIDQNCVFCLLFWNRILKLLKFVSNGLFGKKKTCSVFQMPCL